MLLRSILSSPGFLLCRISMPDSFGDGHMEARNAALRQQATAQAIQRRARDLLPPSLSRSNQNEHTSITI
jgi:hypothetical protein